MGALSAATRADNDEILNLKKITNQTNKTANPR